MKRKRPEEDDREDQEEQAAHREGPRLKRSRRGVSQEENSQEEENQKTQQVDSRNLNEPMPSLCLGSVTPKDWWVDQWLNFRRIL